MELKNVELSDPRIVYRRDEPMHTPLGPHFAPEMPA